MDLRGLSDDALLGRLAALAAQERESVADVVEHLAEAERRDIVIDRGYPSLFHYCVRELRYAESAAFLRIRAARAAGRCPGVVDALRSGRVHLDSVMRLAPHIDAESGPALLERAAGASKAQVLAIVASLGGESAPERDVVRLMPRKPPDGPPAAQLSALPFEGPHAPTGPDAAAEGGDRAQLRPDAVEHGGQSVSRARDAELLADSRVRFAFTADAAFAAMVDRLRSLRRHKFPEGRLEDLFRDAVAELLGRLEPTCRTPVTSAAVRAGRQNAGPSRSRRIPAAVRRAVWSRDEGRCAYVSPDGRRCGSREFLEYDHVVPWALGGRSDTPENIRLLCRPHNLRLARRRFGPRVPARPAAPPSA